MIKMEQKKKLVLIGVQTEMIFRDFSQSGTFEGIKQEMDICFVTTSNELAAKLKPYGPVIGSFRPVRFSNFLWDSSYQTKTIRAWRNSMGLLGKAWFQRKVKASWDAKSKIAWLLNVFHLGYWYEILIRFLFRLVNFRTMALKPPRKISLVVVPTIVRDYFADELIRYAQRIGAPSLGLQVNFDAFNVKSSIETPTHMAVWGEQSWYLSRLGGGIKTDDISVLGTPRYINYQQITKRDARKKLNLDSSKILWLFAGSTAAFQEIAVLKKIDSMINSGSLPPELIVLYKPHPKGQQDKNQPEFIAEHFKNVILFSEPGEGKWTDLEVYPALLSAIDGVITPYSTMALEAALMGLPLLCVGYHNGEYSRYWDHAKDFYHLRVLQDRKFCLHCNDRSHLESLLVKFVQMRGDREITLDAQQAAYSVLYQSDVPYKDRLLSLMNSSFET